MGHMQTARMPMAKRARGQQLTEKSETAEPSKQAEVGEEDRRPNYIKRQRRNSKMLKNSNSAIIIFFFSFISMSQRRINLLFSYIPSNFLPRLMPITRVIVTKQSLAITIRQED